LKHFKPIVEPLKQIIENTANDESQSIIKKEVNVVKKKNKYIKKRKPKNNKDVHNDEDDNDDLWMDHSINTVV